MASGMPAFALRSEKRLPPLAGFNRAPSNNDIDFADGEIRILAINETSYPESLDPACSRRAQQGVVPMLFETEKRGMQGEHR